MKITEKLRAKIVLHLPKRYAKIVAEKCNVSEQTVYNVLHHGSSNLDVTRCLLELANETKLDRKKANKQIRSLTKRLSTALVSAHSSKEKINSQ